MDHSARIIVLTEVDRDGKVALGMNLFLASWGVMFLALLGVCALVRVQAPSWPPPNAPVLPLGWSSVATVVLALSSLSLQTGLERVRHARPYALPRWLLVTLALGTAFLLLQAHTWQTLWDGGLEPRGSFGSTFYVLTVFHAVHVAVALGLVAWLAQGAFHLRYHARNYLMVTLVTRFWHFLGLSWALIFLGVYVW